MKRSAKSITSRTKRSAKTAPSSAQSAERSVPRLYSDFSVWSALRAPRWHPIKKMRYVFWRMIAGTTVTDALLEIQWNHAEFWHLVDLKRHAPFREEYHRAKVWQSRALSDSVVTIAEGRDAVSRNAIREMRVLITQTLKKMARQKTRQRMLDLLDRLCTQVQVSRNEILNRNRVQIDAAKWIAKTSNPIEFGDTSKLALTGNPAASLDGSEPTAQPILVAFVGPDGKVISL